MKRQLKLDVFALASLAALVWLFFWRILTPNANDRAMFPAGDFSDQFYAFRLYEARAFAQGRLPLWSEDINAGHPFLADIQAAVFYPPALVNTLLNALLLRGNFSFFALELEAIFHFVLAGTFTYLFARRVLNDRIGAFVSAMVFTFGGYLTSYPPLQLAILETATWLPLTLYFIQRATEEREGEGKKENAGANYIFAGATLALAFLAGHPQTFLFVVYACAIYFIYRVLTTESPNHRITLSRLLVSLSPFLFILLVAFGLTAIQLVPSLEYMQLSTRQTISFAEAARGFATLDILQFILPGFVSAFASPLYVGVLPLWLAVFAFVRANRDAKFFALLGIGSLLLAFGYYVFAYAVFYNFAPGFSIFRQQERLALVVSLSLALLAGFGMRELRQAVRPCSFVTRLWALLPMGAVVSGVMLFAFFIAGAQNSSGRISFLGDRAGLMVVLFALATLLVGAYARGGLNARVFAFVALAFIAFDLFSINEPANKAAPYERYPATPLLTQLERLNVNHSRVANIDANLPGHFGIGYDLEEIGGISPLRLARYDAFLQLPQEKVWALLNVGYILSGASAPTDSQFIAQYEGTKLYSNLLAFSRAWMVGNVVVEPADSRALNLIAQNDFDPAQTAIVDASPPFSISRAAINSTIEYNARDAEHLSIRVTTDGDGLLVVSENDYPGWRAFVDGVETPILRADVTLRAVPLRAGTHRVEMIYDPLSYKMGAGISLVTLFAVIAGLIFTTRKSRQEI